MTFVFQINMSVESELLPDPRGLLPHHRLGERVEGDGLDGLFCVYFPSLTFTFRYAGKYVG